MLRDKWKEVFLYFKHALHKYYVVLKHAACALFFNWKGNAYLTNVQIWL